ncbi:hypothetical protein SK128_022731 [Halocaridina rubra]|uniref:Alpha 1,4-glycosyltransferase domain-containing protein n=1 Tax=Halocaridina rubra TaxID=373956 RepID=A0AAN9A2S9_HALRR
MPCTLHSCVSSFQQTLHQNLRRNFDAWLYTSIGPELLTKTLHHYCPGSLAHSQTDDEVETCRDISVFSRNYFNYFYHTWETMVSMFETGTGSGEKFFNSSKYYILHLMNSYTHKLKTYLYGDSVITEAAKRNCPKVYKVALKINGVPFRFIKHAVLGVIVSYTLLQAGFLILGKNHM